MRYTKADVLKELLTKDFAHIPWGLTGTIPQAEHEQVSPKACLGEVVHKLASMSYRRQVCY